MTVSRPPEAGHHQGGDEYDGYLQGDICDFAS
jgi:hypothetical protein